MKRFLLGVQIEALLIISAPRTEALRPGKSTGSEALLTKRFGSDRSTAAKQCPKFLTYCSKRSPPRATHLDELETQSASAGKKRSAPGSTSFKATGTTSVPASGFRPRGTANGGRAGHPFARQWRSARPGWRYRRQVASPSACCSALPRLLRLWLATSLRFGCFACGLLLRCASFGFACGSLLRYASFKPEDFFPLVGAEALGLG